MLSDHMLFGRDCSHYQLSNEVKCSNWQGRGTRHYIFSIQHNTVIEMNKVMPPLDPVFEAVVGMYIADECHQNVHDLSFCAMLFANCKHCTVYYTLYSEVWKIFVKHRKITNSLTTLKINILL